MKSRLCKISVQIAGGGVTCACPPFNAAIRARAVLVSSCPCCSFKRNTGRRRRNLISLANSSFWNTGRVLATAVCGAMWSCRNRCTSLEEPTIQACQLIQCSCQRDNLVAKSEFVECVCWGCCLFNFYFRNFSQNLNNTVDYEICTSQSVGVTLTFEFVFFLVAEFIFLVIGC